MLLIKVLGIEFSLPVSNIIRTFIIIIIIIINKRILIIIRTLINKVRIIINLKA